MANPVGVTTIGILDILDADFIILLRICSKSLTTSGIWGQIHLKESGLALIPGVDEYEKI